MSSASDPYRRRGSSYLSLIGAIGAGAAGLALSSAIVQAATLVANLAIARTLGAAGFGVYAFMLGSVNAVVLVVHSSLGLMANKFLAEYVERDAGRAREIISGGTRLAVLTGALGAIVLTSVTWLRGGASAAVGHFHLVLALMAVTIALAAIAQFHMNALAGLQDWRRLFGVAAVQAAGTLVLAVGGAHWFGTVGACAGLMLATAVRMFAGRLSVRWAVSVAGIPERGAYLGGLSSSLRGFVLPALLASMAFAGSQWTGSLLLMSIDNGDRHFGIYAAGYTLRTLVVFMPSHLSVAGLILMSRYAGVSSADIHRKLHATNVLLAGVGAAVIAVALGLMAPFLLGLFGSDFLAARSFVYLMLVAGVIESIAAARYQSLPSRGLMWASFLRVALPRDVCFILAAAVLVPGLREWGLVAALIVSQLIVILGVYYASAANRGASPQ